MKWIVGVLAMVLTIGAAVDVAQEQPAAAPAPEVPANVRQDLGALQVQIAGLAHAQQVLQKELDAVTAQFQRGVQQAQTACAAVPGYELAPTLTCIPKKPEPKKDGVKKESPPQ